MAGGRGFLVDCTLQNGYDDRDGGVIVAVGRERDSNAVSALPAQSDGIPNA